MPPARRGDSRLLVLDRSGGGIVHDRFLNIDCYLRAGDLLVLNDTRVFPARLIGHRVPSGGAVECLLVAQLPLGVGPSHPLGIGSSQVWQALMHPGQKLKPGARVIFERDGVTLHGEVLARHFQGRRTIRLWTDDGQDVAGLIDRIGPIPLPPYIKRPDTLDDRERYQTVYAHERGSIAAPTAGLHFTTERLDALARCGVEQTRVTLHVGYGTFKPIRSERVEDHEVDSERLTVSASAADAL